MNREMTFFYLSALLLVGCKTKEEDLAPVFPDAPAYSDEYRKYLETDSVCFTRLEGNNYLLMGMGASAALSFEKRHDTLYIADTILFKQHKRWFPLLHYSANEGDVVFYNIHPDASSELKNYLVFPLVKIVSKKITEEDTIFSLLVLPVWNNDPIDSLSASEVFRNEHFNGLHTYMLKSGVLSRKYLEVSVKRGILDLQVLGIDGFPLDAFISRIALRHRKIMRHP